MGKKKKKKFKCSYAGKLISLLSSQSIPVGNFAAESHAGEESITRTDSKPVPAVPGLVCVRDSAGPVFKASPN